MTICCSAQEGPVSEGGLLDTLYDGFGNKIPILSASINSGKQMGFQGNVNAGIPSSSCSAGYFNLYFAQNMVFGAVQIPSLVAQAQGVVCQVFTDFSGFINTHSLSVNPAVGPKINILIGSSTSGNVASASPLYVFPPSPSNPNQGYIDGLVHQMLLTSADPYLTLPITFTNSANFSSGFFHGYLNFSPSTQHDFNLSITAAATGNLNDLYTVTLHEIGHLLGIGSLITSTGSSILGANNNFYSRWDTKLFDAAGGPLLGAATSTSCISDLSYTASPNSIAPGGTCITDETQCSSAAQYSTSSLLLPLYTPNCFEVGSSLSHLEDMCSTSQFTPSNTTPCTTNTNLPGYTMYNNLYFLMTGQIAGCNTKRYFRDEERQVLCDLGYSVQATYFSTSGAHIYQTSPFYGYSGGGCDPSPVIGVNDGLINGSYIYTTTSNSITIPTQAILLNDYPASGLSVSCVEIVYTNASTQFSASLVSGSVVVSGAQGAGLAIVRYVPVNSTGEMGNATYIFVYFTDPNCNPATYCNMVQNGSFESSGGTSCGVLETFPSQAATMDCWEEYPLGSKPYLYVRNCSNGVIYNLNNNTLGTGATPINSFNGSPNDKAVAVNYTAGVGSSALKNHLSMPLIPGQTYDISFYALNHPGLSSSANTNTNNNSLVLTVAAHTVFPFVNPGQFPTGLVTISQFTIPCTNNWAYYSQTFTLPTSIPVNLAGLVVGINSTQTALQGTWNNGMTAFCFLDNVSLVPSPAIQFVIPSQTLCGNQPIGDLDGIMTGTALTAFTGSAVTFNNGKYSFNLNSTLSPGDYWITCSYTLSGGCAGEAYHKISISTNTNYPVLTSTLLCTSSPTIDLNTLLSAPASVTGGTFYLNTAPVSTITSVPLGSVSLLAFSPAGSNLCSAFIPTAAIGAYTVPEAPLAQIGGAGVTSTVSCATGSLSLNASNTIGPYSYLWEPGSLIGANQTVNPSSPTIYTVNVFDSYSVCPSTATLAVNAVTNCCNSSTINALTATSFTQATPISGPLLVGSSFTIEPGATLFMDGEFRFTSNASITIASGAVLNIVDAHLFACGDYMWPGIVVKDGGRMTMGGSLKHNLIEDAKIAIDASDQFTTSIGTILDLSRTTFNRNYKSIKVTNYTGTSNGYISPLKIENCVFTSRDLPYTQSTWPQTGTLSSASSTAADLRFATSSTAGLAPPYLGQNSFTVANLKGYSQPAHLAIELQNVGSIGSGAYTGAIIGESTAGAFNVFDGHGRFIRAFNSNLTLRNNVFQNTQRYIAPLDPDAILVLYAPTGGEAVESGVNSVLNCALTLTGSTHSEGNRFFDCHYALKTHDLLKIDCQRSTFRSTQSATSLPSGTFIPQGQAGFISTTNRFEYFLRYNEFTNISSCINVPLAAGQYSTSAGISNGIYASYIGVIQNTFAAATSTTQFINSAVNISCANNFTTPAITNTNVTPHASGIFIENNDFTNVFRGININGNAGLYTEVSRNNIQLKKDDVFGISQHGVKITACLASNSGGNYTTVHANNAVGSGTATPNPLETLFYGSMNSGTNSPRHTCNDASEAFAGFTFESYNDEEIWAGNVMQPLSRGLVLDQGGKIGEQGDVNTSSNNNWAGTWSGTLYTTYTGTNSFAQQSKIWCAASLPGNHDGQTGWALQNWYDPFDLTKLQVSNGGDYNCIGIPNNIVLRVPDAEMYETDALYSTAENLVYRMIHLDPGVTATGEALDDWYLSLAGGTSAKFMTVEAELFNGDYSSARSINDLIAVDENNGCEVSYRQFYTLYANHLESAEAGLPFSQVDSAALFVLSSLCPATNGPAVYQARALYQYIYLAAQVFSNCEDGAGERRARKEFAIQNSESWNVRFVPNPFHAEITVHTEGESKLTAISIFDVTGRKVFETILDRKSGVTKLPLNLTKGIYFATATNEEGMTITQKLICIN